eukprot:TRINITY_DN18663_c0_g1_i2.p1 TRINITY_DN18663_c0_g1~~TRINITY_DN18663_c0_g1_i2.p1  ORF type:complete len:292 (+),score=36.71 TRINITY_DN18663_c0_g1_i2:61-876(+)
MSMLRFSSCACAWIVLYANVILVLAHSNLKDQRIPSALAADDACSGSELGNALIQTQGKQKGKVSTAGGAAEAVAGTRSDAELQSQNRTELVRFVNSLLLAAKNSSSGKFTSIQDPNETMQNKSGNEQILQALRANSTWGLPNPFAPSPPPPPPPGASCTFPKSMHVCNLPMPKNVMCIQSCALFSWAALDTLCVQESGTLISSPHASVPGSCSSSYNCPIAISDLAQFSTLDPIITKLGTEYLEANGVEFIAQSVPLLGCSISSIVTAFR